MSGIEGRRVHIHARRWGAAVLTGMSALGIATSVFAVILMLSSIVRGTAGPLWLGVSFVLMMGTLGVLSSSSLGMSVMHLIGHVPLMTLDSRGIDFPYVSVPWDAVRRMEIRTIRGRVITVWIHPGIASNLSVRGLAGRFWRRMARLGAPVWEVPLFLMTSRDLKTIREVAEEHGCSVLTSPSRLNRSIAR